MRSLLFGLILAGAVQAQAATILPAALRGSVAEDGTWGTTGSGTPIGNYLTGYEHNSKLEYRSVFVFDLAGVTGPVTSAELQLYVPASPYGFLSYDATETVNFYDYVLDAAALSTGDPGLATYNDAGSGTVYASIVLSDADQGTLLTIMLNAAGVTAINNQLGGLFALGGRMTTISDSGLPQYAFGNSLEGTSRLVLQTPRGGQVPEPGTVGLLGAGLAWLAWRGKARR